MSLHNEELTQRLKTATRTTPCEELQQVPQSLAMAIRNFLPPKRSVLQSLYLSLVHAQVPINPEHVVLANCIDNNGTQLSKMLYYSADITLIKDDSATVTTKFNETAKWEGETISAKFPTGVVFEATLQSPRVKLNHFAGPGTNAYVDFNCFFRPKPWWSNVDGISCYQLYDCTHELVAINATSTRARVLDDQRSENIIALGVGLGVGVPTLIVTVVGTWYAHRRRQREEVVA